MDWNMDKFSFERSDDPQSGGGSTIGYLFGTAQLLGNPTLSALVM